MAAAAKRNDHFRLAMLLGGGVLFGLALLQCRGVANDDAFITYRYSRNLLAGEGLVFNPGERVLATTAPLYALLLAAVGLAADDLPWASNVIGTLAVAAQAALAARLLGKAAAPRILAGAAALFLLGGGLGSYWYLGLETNLAAALLLAALVAALENCWRLAPALAALACLVRPDGVLLAALLFPFSLAPRARREAALGGWVFFAGAGLLWVAFSSWYYGSLLPTSLGAKNHTTPAATFFWQAGLALGSAPLSWTLDRSPLLLDLNRPTAANLAVSLVTWTAALAGLWPARRRSPFLALPALCAFLILVSYSLIAPPLEHTWHLYPAQLLLFTGALLGAARLLAVVREPAAARFLPPVTIALVLGLGVAFLLRFPGLHERDLFFGQRAAALEDMARTVERLVPPDAKVSALEIGILGYRTPNPYVDRAGLATPDLFWHDPARRTSLAQSLARHPTDWIVLFEQEYPPLADGFREVHRSGPYGPLLLVERRRGTAADPLSAPLLLARIAQSREVTSWPPLTQATRQ